MNSQELKAVFSLSLVFALRMFGLFILLPVLAVYADQLYGATPIMVGLAIGAYGISQSFLQIPAGLLSDHIGRKPVILGGLMLFVLGSVVAGVSDSMVGIIVGRFLQGAGAIAAAITALLADLVREENRSRSMAIVGMTIGLAFCGAMVCGPLMAGAWGLSGMFAVSAAMGLGAMALVHWQVPEPVRQRASLETITNRACLQQVLTDKQLMRLNVGVFILHFILIALFVHFPLALERIGSLPVNQHWWIYLGAMVVSFVLMVPFIILGEKHRCIKNIVQGAILVLLAAQLMRAVDSSHLTTLIVSVLLFFVAFNYLEATLPSLVSRLAPAGSRGTAMGAFSTCQFLGAGLGGLISGYVYQHMGETGILILVTTVTALWWLLSVTMINPPHISSIVLDLYPVIPSEARRISDGLTSVAGVREVVLVLEEQAAYLKVDRQRLDERRLRQFGEW